MWSLCTETERRSCNLSPRPSYYLDRCLCSVMRLLCLPGKLSRVLCCGIVAGGGLAEGQRGRSQKCPGCGAGPRRRRQPAALPPSPGATRGESVCSVGTLQRWRFSFKEAMCHICVLDLPIYRNINICNRHYEKTCNKYVFPKEKKSVIYNLFVVQELAKFL